MQRVVLIVMRIMLYRFTVGMYHSHAALHNPEL